MHSWVRTGSFALVQLSATVGLHLWSNLVQMRFRGTHPGEVPARITAWCWSWSPLGIYVALGLSLVVAIAHWRGRARTYEASYYLGHTLLVGWAALLLVAMEVSFIPVRE